MKKLAIENRGLHIDENPYIRPSGSLSIAKNVDLEDDSVLVSRKGFEILVGNFPLEREERFLGIQTFNDKTLVMTNRRLFSINKEGKNVLIGRIGNVSFFEGFVNFGEFYFSTDNGVKKLSRLNKIEDVSLPMPTKPNYEFVEGNLLQPGEEVLYRIVFREKETYIRGAVSSYLRVQNNTELSHDVKLKIGIPVGSRNIFGIDERNEVEIYRSRKANTLKGESANDELYKVAHVSGNSILNEESSQNNLEENDNENSQLEVLAPPFFAFFDRNTSIGEPLYTNGSLEGIINTNRAVPQANVMTLYKGFACYGNVRLKGSLVFNVTKWFKQQGSLSLDRFLGARIRFTSQKGSFVIQAQERENLLVGAFKIGDLKSFLDNINEHPNNSFVRAYDISVEEFDISKLLFEAVEFGDQVSIEPDNDSEQTIAFGSVCEPALNDTLKLEEEKHENRIYFSKRDEASSVPIYRYLNVGKEAIIKFLSYRDSLLVFKKDGVYRIGGDDFQNFSVSQFLKDVELISPQSVSVLEDQIFCLTNYGFLSMNEHGYEEISNHIENLFLKNYLTNRDFYHNSFGIAYKEEKKYFFFTRKSISEVSPSLAYVYHTQTGYWTEWSKSAMAGGVDFLGRLCLLDGIRKNVIVTRSSGTFLDFRDESYGLQIEGNGEENGKSFIAVVFDDALPSEVMKGMYLSQGLAFARVDDVVKTEIGYKLFFNNSFVINETVELEISFPIEFSFRYNRMYLNDPSSLKKIDAVYFLLGPSFQRDLRAHFLSDISPYEEEVALLPIRGKGFGSDAFGEGVWGGASPLSQRLKSYVPRNKNVFGWIEVGLRSEEIFNSIKLLGVALEYRKVRASVK